MRKPGAVVSGHRRRQARGEGEPVDVVLGVAVTGRVARLAMIDTAASDEQVLDQYALDLSEHDATTDLADTIVGTYRAVAESGNRVAATRLCLPDPSQAETLRQTVSNAGVHNVEVVTEAEAAAALQQWPEASTSVMLVGQRLDLDSIAAELSSTAPVQVPPDPGFAIARGA